MAPSALSARHVLVGEGFVPATVVLRDGVVAAAGGTGVAASGRAGADGRSTGTLRSGLASVSVSGRLRGTAGSGRWSLAGISPCSGRWTARRTG